MKLRKPKFVVGELLRIPLGGEEFGYARVLNNPNFGCLLEVYKRDQKASVDQVEDIAFVNRASARKSWQSVGEANVDAIITKKIPPFFYGNNVSGWTIKNGEETQWIEPHCTSSSALKERGFIRQILWLTSDIEDLIRDGIALCWPGEEE